MGFPATAAFLNATSNNPVLVKGAKEMLANGSVEGVTAKEFERAKGAFKQWLVDNKIPIRTARAAFGGGRGGKVAVAKELFGEGSGAHKLASQIAEAENKLNELLATKGRGLQRSWVKGPKKEKAAKAA